jgi:hypothetical protein
MALTFMIDRWLKAVDKGELIGAVFLDLAKAFDLLDHELLLQKLQKCKFSYTSNDLNNNLTAVNKVNCIYLGNSSNDSSHVFQGFLMLMVKLQ